MKQKCLISGSGFEDLEQKILSLAQTNWNPKHPLPATRLLAEAFQVSHSKVYRLLLKFVSEGVLVAHDVNGRFYLKGGEAFATKNYPVACLFRTMENWFFAAKDQLTGISRFCEGLGRGMTLYHHSHLVSHDSIEEPPRFGTVEEQIRDLRNFFENHFNNCSGVILEDLWKDEALKLFSNYLHRAVIMGRKTALRNLKSVSLDVETAAYQALAHLHGRGFRKIMIASPFEGNQGIDHQIKSLQEASQKLGFPISSEAFQIASTLQQRQQLVAKIKNQTEKVAIYCPEDNVSALLFEEIQKQGIPCPEKVGILSGMGEVRVLGLQISSIRYDYVQMGHLAVTKLFEKNGKMHEVITPSFAQGVTT